MNMEKNMRTGKDRPYLSVVVTARNDNHGGRLLERMQIFIDCLLDQAKRYSIRSELIIVEWNPPEKKPKLEAVLDWSHCHDLCPVRIVEVPPDLHARYRHGGSLPLYQMIGKNVGVVRATGEYILCTNIDIICSNEMMEFLASERMLPDRSYRVDRFDVPEDVPAGASLDEILKYCSNNVIRHNLRNGTNSFIDGTVRRIYPDEEDGNHSSNRRERLHTNACGDFTLMHRSRWFALRGYPEFDAYSFHLDSVLCFAAHFGGAREVYLPPPMVTYHIEHEGGWAPEKSKEERLRKRLSVGGISVLSDDQFDGIATAMTENKQSYVFAPMDWGLSGDVLPEKRIDASMIPTPWHPEKVKSHIKREEPYLSIVVAGRNDDHGVGFLKRSQSCLDVLAAQCLKYDLKAELIIVDWNTPEEKPPLARVMTAPPSGHPLTVRFISVPQKLHRKLKNNEVIPFYQMIAKNVGIRRARGKFVLAANMDVVFSDEIIEFLAREELEENAFYRADRYDLSVRFLKESNNLEEIFAHCRRNVARVHRREDRQIHTNACGDFTLLSREKWLQTGGYPEYPLYSLYIDAIFLYMAAMDGVAELFLPDPYRVYHLEHDNSWSITDRPTRVMPTLDWSNDVMPLYQKMFEARKNLNPNPPNWGFANENLVERSGNETEGPAVVSDENADWESLTTGHPDNRNLTIFSAPGPIAEETACFLENAVKSWLNLQPRPEIILFGNTPEVREFALRHGLKFVEHDTSCDSQGTQLRKDLFIKAQELSDRNSLAYVDSRMILTGDFMDAVGMASDMFHDYMMVGRNWDFPMAGQIVFSNRDWESQFKKDVMTGARLREGFNINYVVFRHGVITDSLLDALLEARRNRFKNDRKRTLPVALVDATSTVPAVIQILPVTDSIDSAECREVVTNMVSVNVYDANWELSEFGLIPRGGSIRIDIELVKDLFRLSINTLLAGKFEDAVEKLDETITTCGWVKSYITKAYYAKALALMQLGRPDEAEITLQGELRVNPDHTPTMELLSTIEELKKNRNSSPDAEFKLTVRRVGALFAFKQGYPEVAESSLARLVEEYPKNPGIKFDFAHLMRLTERGERAMEELGEVIRMAPDFRDAFIALGHLLFQAGRPGEACGVFGDYLRRHPEEIEMMAMLNHCRSATGINQPGMVNQI